MTPPAPPRQVMPFMEVVESTVTAIFVCYAKNQDVLMLRQSRAPSPTALALCRCLAASVSLPLCLGLCLTVSASIVASASLPPSVPLWLALWRALCLSLALALAERAWRAQQPRALRGD